MIIVKLQGGLGNQMFQYAFGKTLAAKLSNSLYFDSSFFKIKETDFFTRRNYELDLFPIQINTPDRTTIKSFTDPKPVQRILNRLKINKKEFYKESSLKFNKDVFLLSTNIYLDGYWQSERYFKCLTSQIRKDFIFTKPLNKLSTAIEGLINENNTVSVHIRRGDYVSLAANNRVHGTCTVEYYLRAIQILNARLHHPQYLFFSDEPEWVQQNLVYDLRNFQIIKHNLGTDSWQDMSLMSKCKHHVIANSSFSWWGAWLNPSPDKIVIAPKTWFAQPDLNHQSITIIPQNWIRI